MRQERAHGMMRSTGIGLAALTVLGTLPVAAQQPSAAGASAVMPVPDPARLAAAHALVDAAMPPETREKLIRGMIEPTMTNVEDGMFKSPQMIELFAKQPQAREILHRLLAQQLEASLASMQHTLPQLLDAMAKAYARRFSVVQLDEVRAFYLTPTGRSFMAQMPAVMADPDIVAAQRSMMADAMARLPAAIQSAVAELTKADKAVAQ